MRYNPNARPLNDGDPWTEMCTDDLIAAVEHGGSVAEIAMFLQRREEEVREKIKEFGLPMPKD